MNGPSRLLIQWVLLKLVHKIFLFIGWYFRFLDFENNRSFATLFGAVLPKDPTAVKNPAYFGLLRQVGNSLQRG